MDGAAIYQQAVDALGQGDPQKALVLFQRAADRGQSHALYRMAVLYGRGLGVTQSCRMAELLLAQAAARHDRSARRLLRYMNWKRLKRRPPQAR
jgi:TPR repeat protein